MFDDSLIRLDRAQRQRLPPVTEIVEYCLATGRPTAVGTLRDAVRAGRPAIQPRCGVGGHAEMLALLSFLDTEASPDLLSVTIDSHTRLRHFATADRIRRTSPDQLNGYPLVSHGWQRGRELTESVGVPLQVRHGSPDARELFAFALASGITSFEGGGISYNLPYSKDVPLARSLHAWQQVDAATAELGRAGVAIERELFGTLTAVLVPPSLSIAVSMIEALLAAEQGVTDISIAYPQSGEVHQDIAALRAMTGLAERYLPAGLTVYPVLHEYMGVFPRERRRAEELVFYGALVGRLGGAAKVINKTYQEALGIPTEEANAAGIRLARIAGSDLLGFVRVDEGAVAEEREWIEREVGELLDPMLQAPRLAPAVCMAFAEGRLDIPFSASVHAHAAVLPMRDARGAVRYRSTAGLPLSAAVRTRHHGLLETRTGASLTPLPSTADMLADIDYFAD